MQLTLRNASLTDLITELREQRDRKADYVVPSADLGVFHGDVLLRGMGEAQLTDDGVTRKNLELVASEIFDDGVSAKLGVPRAYLRTMRDNGWFDLYDHNVNGLLHGFTKRDGTTVRAEDPRKFLLRTFTGQNGGKGYVRALLSNSYKTIDNWDVLGTIVQSMTDAGLDDHVVRQADLTNRRMYVRIVVPEVQALAPELLKNYRSPFSGNRGIDNPIVFAGLTISNSDTGYGAFSITPTLEIQVCTNGMTITRDAVRKTHLGARMDDDGVIKVSDETYKRNVALIASQTRDAVDTFLDADYMRRVIQRVEEAAGAKISKPQEAVKELAKRDAFSQDDMDGILNHFIQGADTSVGGLFNAITSYSQTIEDADKAYAMDADALAAAGLAGVSGR